MSSRRFPVLLAAVAVVSSLAAETFENESVAIRFREPAEGMGVAGVVDKATGVSFVSGATSGADVWAVLFHAHNATGGIEEVRLDNRAPCADRTIVKGADAWRLQWKGLDLPGENGVVDVEAKVALSAKGPASSWTIRVECRSAKWALYETQYPYLRHIVDDGKADVMMPAPGLGARVFRAHVAPAAPEEFNYPGWYPMVSAYMKDGAGLYCAAHDGESRIKRIRFLKDHGLRFETVVENAGVVGKAAKGAGYPVVLATYRGDWWQAAKIYRRWALRQKWCAKGKMIDRADYPRRMSECHAWLLAQQAPETVSNFVVRVKRQWPDAKFGIEWTKWGHQPFDFAYPEMLPARKGVDAVMEYATSVGLPLMPYSNGRLWDTELASWYYAKNDCTRKETGVCNFEKYGPRTFGVMCPSARGWYESFGEYIVRMVDVTKCGVLYIDQIACSRPAPCFNAAHGHTLGGGTWWADGYRKMLAPAHAVLAARNVPITSEGASEVWLDVIDGYLLACAPRIEDVPFYTAVYGGYATYFGSYLSPGTPFDAYYAISARALLWGVEPGWYHGWPVYDQYRRWGDALAELSRCREAAKDFLAYGSLEGEVALAGDVGKVSLEWPNPMGKVPKSYAGEFPGVFATWWMDARGMRHAVALANVTEAEKTVSFAEPFAGKVTLPPQSVRVVVEGQ